MTGEFESRGAERRGRPLTRAAGVVVMVFAVAVVLALLGLYSVYTYVTRPGAHGEPVVFTVPEGATGREVGKLLANEGLVDNGLFFRLAIRLDRSPGTIKYGAHLVPRGASPSEILDILQEKPEPRLNPNAFKITIPEGLTIAQMAETLDNGDAFLAAAKALSPEQELGVDTPNLEGFLMPNTYYFDEPPSGGELVRAMLEQFKADYAELAADYPEAAQDLVKVVTVASLIEEEARVDEERPLVAAVIYNRLAKGRALQMDSTLQYALDKYGQRLLEDDKAVDSPYNTYKYPGLPPGPISNPGVASLRAALAPAEVDYMYFVSNADGKTHTFSRTMREHERAVARYRKEIREQRRALQE